MAFLLFSKEKIIELKMDSFKDFKEKLDQQHDWPTNYMFKFVVPSTKKDQLIELFPSDVLQPKYSKAGNYISFTMEKHVNSSDEVVEIYLLVKQIKGLIVL